MEGKGINKNKNVIFEKSEEFASCGLQVNTIRL